MKAISASLGLGEAMIQSPRGAATRALCNEPAAQAGP